MINFIIILFTLTILYIAGRSRVEAYIKMLSAQGFLLFLLILQNPEGTTTANSIFLLIETLGFKTLIIPLFLTYIVQRNDINREIEPYIPHFSFVVITSFILLLGFIISYWSLSFVHNLERSLYFGISISTIMAGLLIIITRKKIITHIIGYLIIENGIFLLSLSAFKEMPLVVNLGVMLDIFAAIFLFGLFVTRIHSTFDEIHIDTLKNLKD